jgi:hypothetical protein
MLRLVKDDDIGDVAGERGEAGLMSGCMTLLRRVAVRDPHRGPGAVHRLAHHDSAAGRGALECWRGIDPRRLRAHIENRSREIPGKGLRNRYRRYRQRGNPSNLIRLIPA